MNEKNESKPEEMEKPEELLRAEELINDAKVKEAHELLDNFERKEGLILHDKVAGHLLRVDLLFQQGRFGESFTLAEHTYKESLGLGKNILSVDCLDLMANALFYLGKFDEALDVIIQGEELLKNLTQVSSSEYMKRETSLAFTKGNSYGLKGETVLAVPNLRKSLELAEKIDFKRLHANILAIFAFIMMNIRDLDQAFAYIKKGVAIAKESKNKWVIAFCAGYLGQIYICSGDWKRGLKLYNKCISIYEELDNKRSISIVLSYIAAIYRDFTGDYDRASEYVERSLALYNDKESDALGGEQFYTAFTIALKKGDYEGAKKYLQNLEHLNNQVKDKQVDLRHRICKALVLKSSSRFHDMAKAEKILRQIVTEDILLVDIMTTALVNLCDILLAEFRVTNNLKILNELEPLITQLLAIAERTQSHRIQAETYLFQAKLALLSFDVKKSRRFLTQAQQIAERHNLNKLALEISNEHKNLVDRLELWEQLQDSKAPLSERFKLAEITEQMNRMHRNLVVATKIIEEKVIISRGKKICLVCRGEVSGYSYSCKCGANYCENCAKAISNLENVCWACNIPIDYSKPSQPFKEKEDHIKAQEKAKKK